MQAVARIEQQWLRQYATPIPAHSPFYRSSEDETVERHVEMLEEFHVAVAQLPLTPEVTVPYLAHTDLHLSSVMVSEDDSPRITGLLDWQCQSIAPLFKQFIYPEFCLYIGSLIEEKLTDTDYVITLPDNYDALTPDEKTQVDSEFQAARRQKYLETRLATISAPQWGLTQFHLPQITNGAILCAPRTWFEGYYHLRRQIMNLQMVCMTKYLRKIDVPIELNLLQRTIPAFERMDIYDAHISKLGQILQVGVDGYVPIDKWEETKKRSDLEREKWDDKIACGPYPFQEGAPCYFVGT